MEDIIYEFRNIVEESRTEDRQDYYIKLRNVLDLIQELEEENKTLKEITNSYNAFGNDYIPNDMKFIIADREYFHSGIFKESFIPISVIQNTLDNTNKNIEEFTRNVVTTKEEIEQEYWKSELNKAIAKRNVLQEILEKGNK